MHYTIGQPQQLRRGKWRCHIYSEGARAWGPLASSPTQAERGAELAAQRAISEALIVSQAIDGYLEHQRQKGNRENTIATSGHALRRFFAPVLGRPLATLKPARGLELYEALRIGPDALSIDSQRNYLAQAKTMLKWAVKAQLVRSNILADIEPTGRRRHGKPQPRRDEARRLLAACLDAAAAGDDGAVATLQAMMMGMRAGEIISRTVRDLDDGGRTLWVDEANGFKPKTAAGRRPLDVPPEMQELLLERCRAKLPGALLLPGVGGGLHDRGWVRKVVRRLCKRAGIPPVCAHALRGLYATLTISSGVDPRAVARSLGHEEVRTTLRSYAAPGSELKARLESGRAALKRR